jgi:hypothetical protein
MMMHGTMNVKIIRRLVDNMKLLLICVVLLPHSFIFFEFYFFLFFVNFVLFNNVIYVFYCHVHVFVLYVYVWLPRLRFFRAFSSVVRQMSG